MACTDPNCNPACNCSQCCPPTPPPVPPTPPACDGTDCVELYDAACVNYTGPLIECMNIPTGTNMNTVVQTIAANICLCCNKTECISIFQEFFKRFRFTYDVLFAQDTGTFDSIFEEFLLTGMMLKKCKYCCPDSLIYSLNLDGRHCKSFAEYVAGISPGDIDLTCTNCWTSYTSCATSLLTLFDPTLDGAITAPGITINDTGANNYICEYGGFNNVSGICELNKVLSELFTYEEITTIMSIIQKWDLWVVCDLRNGNIIIGGATQVKKYVDAYIVF